MTSTATRTRPTRLAKTGVDRAVTYRLYPSKGQQTRLGELLMWQRRLYNAALEERRGAWRWNRRSVTKFDQYTQLTGLAAQPGSDEPPLNRDVIRTQSLRTAATR
jgi:hypothetical protein